MSICMIAHRGYSGKYHENTALAFEKAFEHGSGGAETDIRVTLDGRFVTSHNSTAVFNDGTELAIAEHTFSELTEKPLKNKRGDETVYLCSFGEYLSIMKKHGMVCFVELKGEWTDAQVADVFSFVEREYSLDKCIFQSFSPENLLKARALYPSLPLMLTFGRSETDMSVCFEHGISIDIDYTVVSLDMIRRFHEKGLEVAVWTVNDRNDFELCKMMGVDYIESDFFA